MNINHMRNKVLFIFILACIHSLSAQKKYSRILIENATVHVGTGQVYGKGLVGVVDGKITLVRNSLAYTYKKEEWDTIINLDGQHLYPGFFAPNSTLGLTEIDAVRASVDFQEVGKWNPNVRSLIAYNCESDVLATVKTNGVLFVQSTPRGGTISGSSSIMVSECWNWEDGVVRADDGIHINWPRVYQSNYWSNEAIKHSENYQKDVDELTAFLTQAKLFNAENSTLDLRYSALKDCFIGNKRFYFHADDQQQLLDIIDLVKAFELKNAVIVGGAESYLVAARLKEWKISVMLPRLTSQPLREDDPIDLPYRLPKLLQDAGVKFCIQNEGDMEAMNARNIPFLAGIEMSYGLTEEEAIRSVTLSPCEIVGIEKQYGSIEEGKMATFFVSKGNALDMRTNDVTLILINGKFAEVTNRQTDLYEKYKAKYGLD